MSDAGILSGNINVGSIITFMLALIAVIFAAYISYKLVKTGLLRWTSRSVSRWTARFTGYIIFLFGLYVIGQSFLGFDIGATLASVGIISIALAFASQQIISSLLAGFLITINRTIALDDWVELGGLPETGISQVKDITFTRTILRDRDGRVYIVPNATLLASKIINYSKSGFIEVSLPLILPFDIPFDRARNVITEALSRHPDVLPNGRTADPQGPSSMRSSFFFQGYTWLKGKPDQLLPRVLFTTITNQGNTVTIRFWIRDVVRREEITSEVLAEVSRELKIGQDKS
jgi:small-conductance mechanosensitive channel